MPVNFIDSPRPRSLLLREFHDDISTVYSGQVLRSQHFAPLELPAKFSIKDGMSPARDQGSAGTCAAFGVMSCLEFHHGKRDLSEADLIHGSESQNDDCEEGIALEKCTGRAWHVGAVRESIWPYDDEKICWKQPPNTSGHTRYKFNGAYLLYRRPVMEVVSAIRRGAECTSAEELRTLWANRLGTKPTPAEHIAWCIARSGNPATAAVPVWFKINGHFDAGWNSWEGEIKMPEPVNLTAWLDVNKSNPDHIDGWHVIALCGFDSKRRVFEFKNSWGPWWGNSGFGTIPFEYIDEYCRQSDMGWMSAPPELMAAVGESHVAGMWSANVADLPSSDAQVRSGLYLRLYQVKLPGVCGGAYRSWFIKNQHGSRSIRATVETQSVYMGQVTHTSEKTLTLEAGEDVELGCSGWSNPSGHDTIYRKRIVESEWAS